MGGKSKEVRPLPAIILANAPRVNYQAVQSLILMPGSSKSVRNKTISSIFAVLFSSRDKRQRRMAEYSKEEIKKIEKKWQEKWAADGAYRVDIDPAKPKYYVLDMFPYPSGAGLHVGHPLGYIASDIVSRYKRTKGFNVL